MIGPGLTQPAFLRICDVFHGNPSRTTETALEELARNVGQSAHVSFHERIAYFYFISNDVMFWRPASHTHAFAE
jgi:hypothetical protein